MQNGSVKSISRFKLGIGAAVVAVAAVAMVTVLASTIGVLSSQSTTPSLTFGSSTYSVVEGESLTITLNATSTENYDLVLSVAGTTPASFEFDNDITSIVLSPDVGSPTPITKLPQTVSIESRTTVITLWFRAANDLVAETGDKLVLNAKPGTGTTVNTEITLTDPPTVEATFSVTGASTITEGGSAEIGITLNNPLTLSHLFSRRSGESGYTREEFTGSNFEDISSIAGAAFPVDDNNEQYNRNLGFDFWFYGTRHSNIGVHTNGFVGFTNDAKADIQENVDTSPPGENEGDETPGAGGFTLPIVAPLLSPLAYHITDNYGMGITPRPAFYGARLGAGTADDRYIVQYTNARAGVPGVTNRVEVTFQVALYASGTIEFRYEDVPTNAQGISKIGISKGTGTDEFDEFSYRTNNFSSNAVSDVRLVYTPKDSLINAVIKNQAGATVETVDFLDNVEVGTQSGSFMVSYPENDVWAGNQAYTVELESTVPLVTAPSPAPAAVTYTVNENDTPQYAITFQSSSELMEGGNVGLNVAITNVDPDGVVADHAVPLPAAADGVALPSVTIMAGFKSADFTVSHANDNFWTGNYNATIRTTSGGGSLMVPVIDNDRPVVRIIAADGSDPITVTEGETNTDNLTLEVLVLPPSGVLSGDTTFKLRRSTMSTTGSPSDMIADVTVPAGMASADFSFNAGADSAFDPGRYVLEIHEAESLGKTVTPFESAVNIVIVDRNPLPITFTVDKTSVAEDDADKTVTFRASIDLSSLINEDLVLVVSTTALTRVSADDVDMIPNVLTIMDGDDSGDYIITVMDDGEVEIDELFELEITELRYRGGVSRKAGGAALTSAAFTIVSDDTASWTLSTTQPSDTVAEGDDLPVTITSDKALPILADPPDLELVVTDRLGAFVISAAIPRTSPLYNGMLSDIVNIPNPHDDLFELDQVYTVRLAGGITIVSATRALLEPAGTLEYTVTDDPNEMPDITLDYGGATTVDEGGMINASITVANAPPTGLGDDLYVQLAFNTMDSTASAADISFPEVGILIPMGQRSSGIIIRATNNDMFDPGEVFALSVNNVWYGNSNRPSGTPVTVGTFDAGGTIRIVNTTDAPAATLTRVGDEDVEEAAIEKIFNITLDEAVPTTDLILSVGFGGTATRNTDYSAPATVTIPAGQTSVNYTVTVITDADAEFDETVMLSISGGETGDGDMFSLASPQNAEFTITNDDIVTVTLTGPASAISESTATQIDITLSIPLPPDVLNRNYLVETLPGSDFEDISSVGEMYIFVPGGNPNRDFLRDLGFDFEFFGQVHQKVTINTNGYVVFTDDDDNSLDFKLEDNFADQRFESGTEVNDLPIAAPFWGNLDIQLSGGIFTATRGTAPNRRFIVQYENHRRVLTGTPANDPRVTFQMVLFESTGQIEFRYEDVSNNQNLVAVGITDGTGTNFEEVGIGKTDTDIIVRDNTRIVFSPLRLDVVTKDDEGQQVGRLNLLTALMAGDTMRTISVPADLSNTDWEADRNFTAEARVANLPFVTLGSSVSYTVEDDDPPVVVLERVVSGTSPITEGGSVRLRARLTNLPDGVGAPEDLVVNLMADPASTAMASEYTFPPSVTIPKNGQHKEFPVSINQDSDVEFEATLNIIVDSLTYTGLATPIRPANVDIDLTIEKSDDPIVFTITFPDGSRVTEGGMVTARITLDKLLPVRTPDSALSLVLKDGNPSNTDVTIVSKDITDDLKTGRSTDVTIQLTDDMLLEGDETVEVMLQIDSTKMPDLAILVPDLPSASFTIIDNDSGMVEIVPPSVSEYYESVGGNNVQGQTVDFELVLDLPPGVTTDIPVIVNYEIVAPTGLVTVSAAGLGTGFAQGLALPVRGLAQAQQPQRSVTIPAGMNRVVLTITLLDDTKAEVTEQLTVRLVSVSTGSAVPLVEVDPQMKETVITVLDDEDPVFEIIGNGEVDEDDGTYPVRLRRLGRLSDNEIVFEIAGDGADDGDFVGPVTGRKFVFSGKNALSDPILLTLDDDNSEEREKTFEIRVYAPGASTPLAAPIVDSSGARFTSITLFDSDVSFSGLPATGGPVLPVWLLLTLALTGVALLIPAFKLNR